MRRRFRIATAVLALPLLAQAPTAPGTATPGSVAPGTAGASAPDAWLTRGAAELILLDRLRNQPTAVSVRTGQAATFGALTVSLRACAVRPPDLPQNAAAFLEVTEAPSNKTVFRGWMLASTPAVAQLENPVYDVRLVTCR